MKDFVETIDDSDKVKDLDNEQGFAFNSGFQFGDSANTAEIQGWDFGADEDAKPDVLEEILKKHRGEDFEEPQGDAEVQDEDSEDESSEGEDQSEDGDQQEEQASEPQEAPTTIESDETGFFEKSQESSASFTEMNLSRPIQKGITALGYQKPTPVQAAVVPVGLLGKDIVAGAETGSGKTAAYMLPTLERLVYRSQKTPATRVIVLTPTRELAMQVHDVGSKLGKYVSNLRFGLAVGGLNLRQQEQELKTRPDVVIATPGRFIDHVRNSPSFSVDQVEVLILDEADRMLEEGFEGEINEILKLIPTKRQTMLFSATLSNSVQSLVKLGLRKPVRIMINPPKQAAAGLVQEFVRIRKHEESRSAILASLLQKLGRNQRTIVFVSQKKTAHRLRVILGLLGIRVGELHGNLSQEERLQSITAFKNLDVPVLLCTDLASRGLDIPKIEVVINYELPSTYEVYLHRVGRTARAGRKGTSISLVGESQSERQLVRSAIQSVNENSSAAKQKILGREIDWKEIDAIKQDIEQKQELVDDVLDEEKTSKEFLLAEREIKRVENIVKHRDEIQSRPKRTWFEDEKTRKQAAKPKTNHAKKVADAGSESWGYKKTKGDRKLTQKRGAHRAIVKGGTKRLKK